MLLTLSLSLIAYIQTSSKMQLQCLPLIRDQLAGPSPLSESERDGQTRKEADIAILIFVNPIGATHSRSERSIDSLGIYADLAHESAAFRYSIKTGRLVEQSRLQVFSNFVSLSPSRME